MRFFLLLGILYQVIFIPTATSAGVDSCGLCKPVDPRSVLEITPQNVANCPGTFVNSAVCEELSHWNGSECGKVRVPEGLSPESCAGIQAAFAAACPCDGAPSETSLLRRRNLQAADTLSVIFGFILDLLDIIFAFINGL